MVDPPISGFTKRRQLPVKLLKGHADLFAVYGGQTFATWMIEQGYSLRTVELYGLYARRASEHLRAQGRSLSRATPEHIEDFWSTLPTSASSRNGARHALIAWYRFRGKRDGGPARLLERIPPPDSLPRPVPEVDYGQMLAAAREMGSIWRTFGSLVCLTGCRMSEARKARWHQFELRGDNPVWYIEGKGSKRRGPKVRQVPLTAPLVDALLAWRRECPSPDWVFPSEHSATGYVSASYLNQVLTEICEQARIERATAHRWRHTVATITLDRTKNVLGVQGLMGHANLNTTQGYARLLPGRLKEVVDSLEPPDGDGEVA